jgi:hypothetical protein
VKKQTIWRPLGLHNLRYPIKLLGRPSHPGHP